MNIEAQFKGNWTREELIVAFNLYCKTPFGQINSKSPEIQAIALKIGRSGSALAIKLANFARLDPALKGRNISGMKNGSKADELIWAEFHNNWDGLAEESERLIGSFENGGEMPDLDSVELPYEREGLEREALVKARVNQSFFRKAVLASYGYRCCITGITVPELLVASHIVPWSVDQKNRMNPSNGLCLNALHDRAFDSGLITVLPDYTLKISPKMLSSKGAEMMHGLQLHEGQKIEAPQRFTPSADFLKHHNDYVFKS